MVMKNLHSDEFQRLWVESRLNRLPLIFLVLVKIFVAASVVFYICNYLTRFKSALMITIALVAIILMALSRSLKHRSIKLERMFLMNLHSREIAAQVSGRKRPLFEGHLLDRDIHISVVTIPEESLWAGKSLKELKFRVRFGVHVSSILRGRQRINIPNGNTIVFPGDNIQVIGNDDQLSMFARALHDEIIADDPDIEKREMKLRQIRVSSGSQFLNKTLGESGIRDKYNCMVVGLEEGKENLSMITPTHKFEEGDVIWVVGEVEDLKNLEL